MKPPSKRDRKHLHAKTRSEFACLDCQLERISIKSLDTILLSPGDGRPPDTGFLQGILSILELKGIKGVDILLLPKGTTVDTLSAEKFQALAESKGFSKLPQENQHAGNVSGSTAAHADSRARSREAVQTEQGSAINEPPAAT